MKDKRTSLDDIAKSLGVSKATVSFVLNGKGDEFGISKEKQQLIKEKARELKYVPNFFAKSLRQTFTKTIGLVLADISNPYYAELCKSIQEELYDRGYNVFIVNTNDSLDLEKTLMRELIKRSIDGMIISPCNKIDELIPILHETHIPVVFTDRPGDENADFVGVDNETEAFKLVNNYSKTPDKLLVLVPEGQLVLTLEKRLSGIQRACTDLNIDFNILHLDKNQGLNNQRIIDEVRRGADSLLSLNNVAAHSGLLALRHGEYTIPGSVRFISFDDMHSFEYAYPGISALRQPIKSIGQESVNRLIDRLDNSSKPGKHLLLECEFIPRGSH